MGLITKRWPLLLILLASLIALSPALRLGAAIGPWDDLRAMMDSKPTPRAFDVLQMDAALQFYGWRDLVFESWGRFEPPYWNPYQLMGTPLLANSQSGGFYPLHILMGVLHVPTALAILLLAWFHLCVAGLGVRALVLRMGGSEVGAAVGGAMFAVSPFMLSWVGLASVVTTCAWIPWALAFCHDLFDGVRDKYWCTSMLALATGMMLLGGHLQFAAYGFLAVLVFGASRIVTTRKWRLGVEVVAGCTLGFMLAGPQLLPVLKYGQSSHRQNDPTEGGYAFYQRGAISPVEAAGIVFPDALGTPGRVMDTATFDVSEGFRLGSFWPAYTKVGGNYAESAVYLGPAVILLLAFAAFRKGWRSASAVAAVGVVGALMAFGTPLNKLLYFYLPGWSSTGSPGRASVLFVLAACAVAGWAWPRVGETIDLRKPILMLVTLTVASLGIVAYLSTGLETWNPGMKSLAEAAAWGNVKFVVPYAVVSLVLVVGACLLIKKDKPQYAAVAMVLATVVIAGPRLVPTGTPLERGTPDPNERTAFVNADWQLLIGLPVVQPPNTATIERKLDVAGYDSLIHSETFAILNEINGRDSAPEANGNMTLIKPGFAVDKLIDAGVSVVVGRDEPGAAPRSALLRGKRATIDSHADSAEQVSSGTVFKDTLTSTTVEAAGPGRLTLRDRNMPGWTATVDGKPAEVKGVHWREVDLPQGDHTVVFKYTPPGLKTGLVLFGLSALLTAAGLVLPRLKKPR